MNRLMRNFITSGALAGAVLVSPAFGDKPDSNETIDSAIERFGKEWTGFKKDAQEVLEFGNPISNLDYLTRQWQVEKDTTGGTNVGIRVADRFADRRDPLKREGNHNALASYEDIATQIADSTTYFNGRESTGRSLLSSKEIIQRRADIGELTIALLAVTGIEPTKLQSWSYDKDGKVVQNGSTIVIHQDNYDLDAIAANLKKYEKVAKQYGVNLTAQDVVRVLDLWYNKQFTARESLLGRWLADPSGEHANALSWVHSGYTGQRAALLTLFRRGDNLVEILSNLKGLSPAEKQKPENRDRITAAINTLGDLIYTKGFNALSGIDDGWDIAGDYDRVLGGVETPIQQAIVAGEKPTQIITDGQPIILPAGKEDAWPSERVNPEDVVSVWEMLKYQGDPKYGKLEERFENLRTDFEALKKQHLTDTERLEGRLRRANAFGQDFVRAGAIYVPNGPRFIEVPEGYSANDSRYGIVEVSWGKPFALDSENRPKYSWHIGARGSLSEQTNKQNSPDVVLKSNGRYAVTTNTTEEITERDLELVCSIADRLYTSEKGKFAVVLELGVGGYVRATNSSTSTDRELWLVKSSLEGPVTLGKIKSNGELVDKDRVSAQNPTGYRFGGRGHVGVGADIGRFYVGAGSTLDKRPTINAQAGWRF